MHVRKLPSGKWRWIAQVNGHRQSGTAPTRREALYEGRHAEVELGADRPTNKAGTVEDLLTAYQAEGADEWSPTYRADVAHVCGHLPHPFLNRELSTVDPAVIATLQRTLTKQGWSPHRIQRVRGCLSGAFVMAVTYGWAHTNPVRDVKAPKVDRSDVHAPTLETVRALLNHPIPQIRLFLWLAANTGARRGELLGLQWGDLDGDDLTIRRAVVQVAGSGPVVRGTKTGRKGERRLELDPTSVALLEAHRAEQAERAKARLLPPPVFVFSPDAGVTPWRPDYIGQLYGRHRRTVPGAEKVRLHDLRHFVATDMLQRGIPLIDVAGQLGHTNPRTTATVYAHVLPGRGGAAARERASRLGG